MHLHDFATLYFNSVPVVRQLVFSVIGNYDNTEDILQEIYLAAWLRFRHEQHPNPMGWIMLTARNKAFDYLRRQIREAEHSLPTDLSQETSVIMAGLYENDMALDMICEEAVPYGRLSPLLQEDELNLLIEHYDHGISVPELANKLHISPSACRMRLHRARKKLKPLLSLDQHCP